MFVASPHPMRVGEAGRGLVNHSQLEAVVVDQPYVILREARVEDVLDQIHEQSGRPVESSLEQLIRFAFPYAYEIATD